jgi:dTDP-4-amino-4,6-dideoxygalactose transaminase
LSETSVAELQDRLAASLGRKHCYLVGRGATAIYLALRALPVKRGKVVLPAIMCPSPANAVLYAGLEPVFCDINLDDYNMDIASLERLLEMYDDVVAIMPVHLYGHPADMEGIQRIASQHQLFVVEDAAQALGAEYGGRLVGAFGDLSILSFGHTKIVDAGWGGAVLCDDDGLAASVRLAFADLPQKPSDIARMTASYRTAYYAVKALSEMDGRLSDLFLSFPSIYRDMYLFRFPPEVADRIWAGLDCLPEIVRQRRQNAQEYDRLLSHPLLRKPVYRHAGVPWRFSFLLVGDVQKAVTTKLRAAKIDVSNWYPPLYRWYSSGKLQPRTLFPNADFLGTHIINLWVDPSLEPGSIGRTCETLLSILDRSDIRDMADIPDASEVGEAW